MLAMLFLLQNFLDLAFTHFYCRLIAKLNERTFVNTSGFKQIIQSPTKVTFSTSSLIDRILANTNEKIARWGLLNVGLFDHQIIFYTRKTKKEEVSIHKQIFFRSFKNYSVEEYEKALGQIILLNYEKYSNTNKAYNNLFHQLIEAVYKIAPLKTVRIKNTSSEWFDRKMVEKLCLRDKLFKKFK